MRAADMRFLLPPTAGRARRKPAPNDPTTFVATTTRGRGRSLPADPAIGPADRKSSGEGRVLRVQVVGAAAVTAARDEVGGTAGVVGGVVGELLAHQLPRRVLGETESDADGD